MKDSSHQSESQAQALKYYKVDLRGLTYAELGRFAPNWIVFLILAVIKLMGVRKKLSYGIPHPIGLIRVGPEQLSARSREVLEPAVAEWERHGLGLAFYCTFGNAPLADMESVIATLLSDDGTIAAITSYTRVTVQQFSREQIFSGAVSRMPDGVVLATTTRKPDYEDLPHRRVHYLIGRTIAEVAAHHRRRLGNIPLEPVPFTPSTLMDSLKEEGRRQTEALIDRGVLVPMTDAEVSADRRRCGVGSAEPETPQLAHRSESGNPYQSPAAPVASPKPAADRSRPLAWPLALIWLLWPPVVVFLSLIFSGEVPSAIVLLLALASNAGFVDSLHRRGLVRSRWVLVAIWLLILIGQTMAVVLAVIISAFLYWHVGGM